MRDNVLKFLFLGVMMAVTFFFSHQSRGGFTGTGESVDSQRESASSLIQSLGELSPQLVTSSLEILPATTSYQLPSGTKSGEEQGLVAAVNPVRNDVSNGVKQGQFEALGDAIDFGFYPTGERSWPETSAAAASVSDLQTGEVYFGIKEEERWPLASVTKLMTAAVAIRDMNPNEVIVFSPDDFKFQTEDEARLQEGEEYRAEDMIRAMLGISSNEAAEALANHYGRASFLKAMNDQAKEWGLESTYFKDPTGISVSNQSTIRDLRRLAKMIYENYPDVFKFSKKAKISVKELKSGSTLKLQNNNLFAGRPDFLGGKTGYTAEANGNLVSIFAYGQKPVLVVILGADDRFGETDKLLEWFKANYKY